MSQKTSFSRKLSKNRIRLLVFAFILAVLILPNNTAQANYTSIRGIDKDIKVKAASFNARLDRGVTAQFKKSGPFNITVGRSDYLLSSTGVFSGETKIIIKPVFRDPNTGIETGRVLMNNSNGTTYYVIKVTGYYSNGTTILRTKASSDINGGSFSFPESNGNGRLININAYIAGDAIDYGWGTIEEDGLMSTWIGYQDDRVDLYIDFNIKGSEAIPLTVTIPGIPEMQAQLNSSIYGLEALRNKLINIENSLNEEKNRNESFTPFIQRISHPREATITFGNSFDLIINATGVPAYMRYRVICEDFDSGWVPEDSITITGIHQEGLKKALVMVSNNPNNPEDGVIAKDEFKFFKASL